MESTLLWGPSLNTRTGGGGGGERCGRWWGEEGGEVLHQSFSQAWASLNREAVEEAGMLGEVGE